ncbi:hypothetical protein AKJ16_DCAP21451, partial [Drosera capensis]
MWIGPGDLLKRVNPDRVAWDFLGHRWVILQWPLICTTRNRNTMRAIPNKNTHYSCVRCTIFSDTEEAAGETIDIDISKFLARLEFGMHWRIEVLLYRKPQESIHIAILERSKCCYADQPAPSILTPPLSLCTFIFFIDASLKNFWDDLNLEKRWHRPAIHLRRGTGHRRDVHRLWIKTYCDTITQVAITQPRSVSSTLPSVRIIFQVIATEPNLASIQCLDPDVVIHLGFGNSQGTNRSSSLALGHQSHSEL